MTDQIVMHLRYAPGKILSSAKWGRTSPEGQSLVVKRPKKVIPPKKMFASIQLSERGTKCRVKIMGES